MKTFLANDLTKPKISVIIPVHNGGNSFVRCLDSLQCSTQQPDEIIVVADGDTDGSWQVAETFGAKVFRYPSAGGPARARNRGAEVAQGDILLFIDADVTVHPNTLLRVEEKFRKDSELAAIIGSYDDAPGDNRFLSQYKNLFHHYTHQVSSDTAFTFWGACGAVRRAVFHEVGGFDENYRKPCVEDIELGYRLRRAGHTIRLCKDVQVKHLKQWTPTSLLKAEFFYRALPWTELILSDRQFDADLNLSYANRFSVILVFALLGCLFVSPFAPVVLAIAPILIISLLIINRSVYHFFYQKRGLLFALRVVPWHWFYFLYGGTAFVYGALYQLTRRLRLPSPPTPYGILRSR